MIDAERGETEIVERFGLANKSLTNPNDVDAQSRFSELWLGGPCPWLERTRLRILGDDRKWISNALTLKAEDVQRSWDEYVEIQKTVLVASLYSPDQFYHYVQAIGHACLAFDSARGWKEGEDITQDFLTHGQESLAAFTQLWQIETDHIAGVIAEPPLETAVPKDLMAPTPSFAMVDKLIKSASVSRSAYLMLRRVLAWLGREAEPEIETTNVRYVLANANVRVVDTLRIARRAEGLLAAYFDPVDSGFVAADERLIQSLQAAWLAVRGQVVSTQNRFGRIPAISLRLTIDEPTRGYLEGESVSGPFACGLWAAAKGDTLDTDVLGSFCVKWVGPVDSQGRPKPTNDIDIDASKFELVQVGHIRQKLAAAEEHRMPRFVVGKGQRDDQGRLIRDIPSDDYEFVHSFQEAETLASAYGYFTGDAECERVLRAYCEYQVELFKTGAVDPQKKHGLEHFVAPWFSRQVRPGELVDRSADRKETTSRERDYVPLSQSHDSLDTKFQSLFSLGNRVAVHEDSGSGKSVFTISAVAWLSEPNTWKLLDFLGERPCLAVRFEHDWPTESGKTMPGWTGYIKALAGALKKALPTVNVALAKRTVEYAMKHGRVILLLDAIDQVLGALETQKKRALKNFMTNLPIASSNDAIGVRIVLTGRGHAIDQAFRDEIVQTASWKFVRIEAFTPWQQYVYLKDFIEKWVGHVPDPDIYLAQLTHTDPIIARRLDNLRDIVHSEAPQDDKSTSKAQTVPEILENIIRQLNQTEHRKALARKELEKLENKLKEISPTIRLQALAERDLRLLIDMYPSMRELLGAPVLLTFVRELITSQGNIPTFVNRADFYYQATDELFSKAFPKTANERQKKRARESLRQFDSLLAVIAFQMHCDGAFGYTTRDVNGLALRVQRRLAQGKGATLLKKWDHLWANLETIAGLTKRLIVESKSTQAFGWKHRGVMEYYAGLYLARDATEHDRTEIAAHSHDPQWHWAFAFAMQLSQLPGAEDVLFEREVLAHSVATLFEPPTNCRWRRPSKLMYDAICLLDQELKPHLRERHITRSIGDSLETLQRFHQTFLRCVNDRDRIALQLVLDDGKKGSDSRPSARPNFIRCPPPGDDKLVFLRGTDHQDWEAQEDEKAEHWVQVDPFWLQTTAVTREQFALFDPIYEMDNLGHLSQYAPHPTCPAIETNWYDAFIFARWVGGSLPTEAQWEFACRAGTTDHYSFDRNVGHISQYAWWGGIYGNGNCASERYAHPVGMKLSNPWGLVDMHGNAYEWCADWYDFYFYQRFRNTNLPVINPMGPDIGLPQVNLQYEPGRVTRGGSWADEDSYCRSGYRDRAVPSSRGYGQGFRVCRND